MKRSWLARPHGRHAVTILSVVFIALLLALVVAEVVSAAPLPPDVDQAMLDQYGLTHEILLQVSDGGTDGLWRPYEAVTRAQYAKFVVRACNLEPVYPAQPTFGDVGPTHPLYGYVEAAAAAGMIKGVEEDVFAPDQTINREQAAAVLMRYLVTLHGRDLESIMPEEAIVTQLGFFVDGDAVSPSLRPEVALAVARCALKGSPYGDTFLLDPQAPVLRIQGAALAVRHDKPGLLQPSARGLTAQGLWKNAFSASAKEVGKGVVSGVVDWGLDKVFEALGGHTQWNAVEDQLKGIQNTLNQVVQDLGDIENQLTNLANEYTVQSNAIKALIAGAAAQTAMNDLDSWYSKAGVDNYQYFVGLYADPPQPQDATVASTKLALFQAELLNPASGVLTDLSDINTTILPTGSSTSGVLTSWVNTVCVGALNDVEIQNAYLSLEYYFCQLISHQMEGVQLLCEANNHQDSQTGNPPAPGMVNGPHATAFLKDTWFPMLQAECDNYFQNVARMVLCNAKGVNSFSSDLLGDANLQDVLARANFICCALEEQITVFGNGNGQGNPQNAYGLTAVELYPAGLGIKSTGLYADAAGGSYGSSNVSLYTVAGGPSAYVFDTTKTPAVLDWRNDWTVKRSSFGGGPNAHPGATFAVHDGWLEPGATNLAHGSAVLQYVDDQYNPVSGPGDDVYLYGCDVISYQYYSGDPDDPTWCIPAPLNGRFFSQDTFYRSIDNCSDPENYIWENNDFSQGLCYVQWDNHLMSFSEGDQFIINTTYSLPQFQYIGPTKPVTLVWKSPIGASTSGVECTDTGNNYAGFNWHIKLWMNDVTGENWLAGVESTARDPHTDAVIMNAPVTMNGTMTSGSTYGACVGMDLWWGNGRPKTSSYHNYGNMQAHVSQILIQ